MATMDETKWQQQGAEYEKVRSNLPSVLEVKVLILSETFISLYAVFSCCELCCHTLLELYTGDLRFVFMDQPPL